MELSNQNEMKYHLMQLKEMNKILNLKIRSNVIPHRTANRPTEHVVFAKQTHVIDSIKHIVVVIWTARHRSDVDCNKISPNELKTDYRTMYKCMCAQLCLFVYIQTTERTHKKGASISHAIQRWIKLHGVHSKRLLDKLTT